MEWDKSEFSTFETITLILDVVTVTLSIIASLMFRTPQAYLSLFVSIALTGCMIYLRGKRRMERLAYQQKQKEYHRLEVFGEWDDETEAYTLPEDRLKDYKDGH
jgi:hypothetical protein